jgi:hypothetical protein
VMQYGIGLQIAVLLVSAGLSHVSIDLGVRRCYTYKKAPPQR